jgi:hypothetical protein
MDRHGRRRVLDIIGVALFALQRLVAIVALVVCVFMMILSVSVRVTPSRRPRGLVACDRRLAVRVEALCVTFMIVVLFGVL